MLVKYFIYKIWQLSGPRIRKILREAIWEKINFKWKLRSGIIIELKSVADWAMYNEICVNGEYDIPIKQAIETASSNRPLNLLDLGANVGFFTIRAMDLIFRSEKPNIDFKITLVEGSPTVYKELMTRLNSSPFANRLRIIHGLIGERNGYDEIYECGYPPGNSVFHNGLTSGVKVPGIKVQYIDLFSLYDDNTEIDVLKCDIEGSEQRFIENYRKLLCRTKIAVFEFHRSRCDVARCIDILHEVGFTNHKQLPQDQDYKISIDLFWR